VIGYAHEIKVEAMTRLGEMLARTTKADGGDAQRTRFAKGTESPPTLAELGLDKKTSMVAQQLARIAERFLAALSIKLGPLVFKFPSTPLHAAN
jgi:hypothetical protein